MYVKRLEENELLGALRLAWEVFAQDIAPAYPSEGVEEFQRFIKYEYMLQKMRNKEIVFFGAIENQELCAMSAISSKGHISLLFVKKSWQRKGVARMLCNAMQQYCVMERAVVRMTVSAIPSAVEAYKHLGFQPTSEEQVQDGIRFVPMVYIMKDAVTIVSGGEKRRKNGVLLLLLFIMLIGMAFAGGKAASDIIDYLNEEEAFQEYVNPNQGETDVPETDTQEPETEEAQGIEGVSCYQDETLSYTIKEETYTYYSDGTKGEYPIKFDVKYPQIEGLENEYVDEINRNLKECAMSTVNVLYLKPSEDTKEAMLKLENPVLVSQVSYKVTYASDELISVAFNDYYFAGNAQVGYVDLRTRNISIKDGTEYELKEIVDLSDAFMEDWKGRMKKEAPGALVLDKVRTSEFYRILNGEILDGNYYDVFWVDSEGVQIGITYHYLDEVNRSNGWITAPFTQDEIKEYKTDSEFWSFIER